jgi:hypothetical protein
MAGTATTWGSLQLGRRGNLFGVKRRFPTGLVVLGLAAFLFVNWVGNLLPSFDNPFRTETVDRSGPAVLKSMRNLQDYHAASGHFEVIVDIEKDTAFVPSAIKGERVLFVAVGEVDAGVDFGGLKGEAVQVDGDAATITLPAPRLFDAHVDPKQSYVYDRDRGLIDRVASIFQDSPTGEQELYVLAEDRLTAAARQGAGLLDRAERNTRAMLTSLLRALGFSEVEIRYEART